MTFGRVAFLSLLLGVAGSATASIFGADDRMVVSHAQGSPYSPIGLVYHAGSDSYGTGLLVDSCHVLTAQHIAAGAPGLLRKERLEFLAGETDDGAFVTRTGAIVVESGGFTEVQWNRDADWLLLKLDQCLGRRFGHAQLRESAPDSPSFQSAGFPSDRLFLRGRLVLDPRCRLVGEANGLWLHTCAGIAGNSGGPLFQLRKAREGVVMEVFAIQAAAYGNRLRYEPEADAFNPAQPFTGLNEAVPVANFLHRIRHHLERTQS